MSLLPGARLSEENSVIEGFRKLFAENMGVTLQNRTVTVRKSMLGELCQLTLIITNVSTPSDSEEAARKDSRWRDFCQKHPNVLGDLYYAEHGEYPK